MDDNTGADDESAPLLTARAPPVEVRGGAGITGGGDTGQYLGGGGGRPEFQQVHITPPQRTCDKWLCNRKPEPFSDYCSRHQPGVVDPQPTPSPTFTASNDQLRRRVNRLESRVDDITFETDTDAVVVTLFQALLAADADEKDERIREALRTMGEEVPDDGGE